MATLRQKKFNGEVTPAIVAFVEELVMAKLRNRPIPGVEPADAAQEALADVVQHIFRFDPEQCSLAGYIAVIVQSTLWKCHRYHKAKMRCGAPLISMETAEAYHSFDMNFLERSYATIRFKLDLFTYAGLNPMEERMVRMLYVGYSRGEVARSMRLPASEFANKMRTIGEKYNLGQSYYHSPEIFS